MKKNKFIADECPVCLTELNRDEDECPFCGGPETYCLNHYQETQYLEWALARTPELIQKDWDDEKVKLEPYSQDIEKEVYGE